MLKPLSALLPVLKAWLNQYQTAVSHIELVAAEPQLGVVVRHTRPLSLSRRDDLQQLLTPLKAVCWFQGDKQGMLETIKGDAVDPRLSYALPDYGLTLSYHPQNFIQANAAVNQKMIEQALRLLKPQRHERFLDLFCGVGNFSLPLSRLAAHVLGVEGIAAMVAQAAENAASNGCESAHFIQADLAAVASVSDQLAGFDGLILDPPRSGAKVICENIPKLSPKRIVYVSCDAATFVRDAQLLYKNRYRLTQVGVVDMFPQTSHSEIMGLFVHPSWSIDKEK